MMKCGWIMELIYTYKQSGKWLSKEYPFRISTSN